VAHQAVLAPPVHHHPGGVDRVEPLLGPGPLGSNELGRHRADARLGEPLPGAGDEVRPEEAVGLHEQHGVSVDAAQREIHGAAEGLALLEAHAAHTELVRDLRGRVVGRVVDHDHFDVFLGEGGGQGLAQQFPLVGGDDRGGDPQVTLS
jgi:hypothetical protein